MQLPTVVVAACMASSATAIADDQSVIIEQIAPTSVSCPEGSTQCRTAEQAAPFIFKGLCDYGISHPNAQASVIALMALESGEFKYKRNAFPGRPGQGTANMQMPPFNFEYARSIEALAPKVANVTSTDGLPSAELDRILDLVVPDEYNFASGPWFLRNKCGDHVISALAANADEGFKTYMNCVGVEIDESRQAYFNAAKGAFGIQ